MRWVENSISSITVSVLSSPEFKKKVDFWKIRLPYDPSIGPKLFRGFGDANFKEALWKEENAEKTILWEQLSGGKETNESLIVTEGQERASGCVKKKVLNIDRDSIGDCRTL